jgi:TPP-dependent pyruvate/acetoin dehydrogenase alpha subunit
MLQTAASKGKSKTAKGPSKSSARARQTPTKPQVHERYLEAFRWMLLARVLEEKLAALYRGGMIVGGVYLGRGQEAVSAACGMFLQRGDVFAPLIRDQAGRSAFGEPLLDVTRTYLGSRQGPMRGRDGNIHRGRPGENQLAMISHLGAMISVTVGKLLAKRMKGEKDFVGLTTIGEGGMQTGATHEGLNIASVEQVPLVVVATNNHFAYSTPNEREFGCADLVDRAKGYGYEGHPIDGTDLNQCLEVIETAVKRARAGRPPQLVVATTLRLAGHGEHDDANYVPPEMKNEPFAQDPVERTEKFIIEQGLLDREALQKMRTEIAAQVDEAVATAQQEDVPVASEEDWCALSTRELTDPSA